LVARLAELFVDFIKLVHQCSQLREKGFAIFRRRSGGDLFLKLGAVLDIFQRGFGYRGLIAIPEVNKSPLPSQVVCGVPKSFA
jgi:hypothetical protein